MTQTFPLSRDAANRVRYRPGLGRGHYESYFIRANHPDEPLAFWIRYTIFNPANPEGRPLGEIWATFFDGRNGIHVSVKNELPLSSCVFGTGELRVKVGDAALDGRTAQGTAHSSGNTIGWNLAYAGDSPPLLLLPPEKYEAGFPKAKSLVSLPMAVFSGTMTVNGITVPVDRWVGSQNHNWGVKHTDHYAWGQVAGFDGHPGSFLEIITARLRIGPFWTPFMTIMVLRHRGGEYALNTVLQGLRADGAFSYFHWDFASKRRDISIEGTLEASRDDFVGLTYYNPPGGVKYCLNTKIASCRLRVAAGRDAHDIPPEVLETRSRAAFEILTDDRAHGVRMHV